VSEKDLKFAMKIDDEYHDMQTEESLKRLFRPRIGTT
jgi:hypothetical protein